MTNFLRIFWVNVVARVLHNFQMYGSPVSVGLQNDARGWEEHEHNHKLLLRATCSLWLSKALVACGMKTLLSQGQRAPNPQPNLHSPVWVVKRRSFRVPQEEVGKRSSITFFVFETLSATFWSLFLMLLSLFRHFVCQTPFAGLLFLSWTLVHTGVWRAFCFRPQALRSAERSKKSWKRALLFSAPNPGMHQTLI